MADSILDADLGADDDLDQAPGRPVPASDDEVDDSASDAVRQRPKGAVDVLSDARPAGARARLRSSRLGTLLVLLVTALVVAGGVVLVNQGNAQNAAAQSGGGTIIKLPGISTAPPPEVGKPAQDFTFTTIDGQVRSLSSFKGKAVWVTFGASWCAGCQAEVPDIQAASARFATKGVVVLGVNISEDNTAVKSYAQRMGLTYPLGADPTSAIADTYAVSAIPSHFFVDATGVVRDIRMGALSPDTMDSILNKLVTTS